MIRLGEQLGEVLRRDDSRRAELDRQHVRDRWKERDDDGGEVFLRCRLERLHRDVDRDEDENRREHGERNQFDEVRQVAEYATEAEEQSRQDGVARAPAHRAVRGLADVQGVVCATPPQMPATSVASASVSRMSRTS